jgi:hypothetical protein
VLVETEELGFDLSEPEACEHGLEHGVGGLELDSDPGVLLPEVLRVLRVTLVLVVKPPDLLDQPVLPTIIFDKNSYKIRTFQIE